MNSRERLEMALNHKEPDRIPSDLGATVITSINRVSYHNLRNYLKLPQVEIKISDIVQQIVKVDDDVHDLFRLDVRDVLPGSPTNFKTVIKDDMPDYTYFYDEWGIGFKSPKVDGLYYDMFEHPLIGEITKTNIDRYPWPDPTDPGRFVGLRERARYAAEVEKQGVILGGLCAGTAEMAAWMRGFEDYFRDFATNPELMGYFLDKIIELKMAYWERALAEAGEYINALVESDDLAGQFDMLISPNTYRKVVKPRHKKLLSFIKSHTHAKIFFHSCGAVRKLIPDLIDIGVDALNPVQVSAAGMDSAGLKRDFGKDISFWGGAMDTQNVLGKGTVQQVKDDVRKRIEDLAPGGGFIFAAVHNIQGNVPPENIIAAWETLREYGIYPKEIHKERS